MTEDAKKRYEEDQPHYDLLKVIVEDSVEKAVEKAMKPIELIMKVSLSIAIAVFAFMFVTQFIVWQKLTEKADTNDLNRAVSERQRDYLMKIDYYKMEVDEHEKIQECFAIPSRIPFVMKTINDHMQYELNLSIGISRGGASK